MLEVDFVNGQWSFETGGMGEREKGIIGTAQGGEIRDGGRWER